MSNTPANHARMPFPRRVLIGGGIIAALVVLFVFMWYAAYVLLLGFAGVLVAILLRSMSDQVARWTRWPDRAALAATIVLLLVIFAVLGWLLVPRVGVQVEQLSEQLPVAVRSLVDRVRQFHFGRLVVNQLPDGDALRPAGPEALSRATGVVSSVAAGVFSIIVVLFVGVYLAVNPVLYTNGALWLVPAAARPRAAEVLAAAGYTLRWWLIGQMITMAAVGVMTALGLWLLGVPMWLTLGLLALLLEFVPNFGPIIAAAPGVLLALAESPTKAGQVVAMYIAVQQVESLLISPLVHQKTVNLPPVLTILAQMLLGVLVGPLGLLLATPLTAVALVLVKMLYVEETLGDDIPTPADHISEEDHPPLPKAQDADGQAAAPEATPKTASETSEQPRR